MSDPQVRLRGGPTGLAVNCRFLRIVVHENLSARQESEVQSSYGRLSHFALISSRDLVLLCTQCVPIPWPSSGGGHRGAIRECSACARPSIQGTRHPGYILLSQLASRSARPLGPRPLHVSGCCAGWKLQRRERGGGESVFSLTRMFPLVQNKDKKGSPHLSPEHSGQTPMHDQLCYGSAFLWRCFS